MSEEVETSDWERKEDEERRQVETFRRIHQLYKRGFRPDWTVTDVEDAIWWRHPGGCPDLLILYPDGKLVAFGGAVLNPNEKRDEARIYNTGIADTAAFDQWLASVKPPTWWQAGRAARNRYFVTPMIMAAFLGVGFLLSLIFRQIWQWLFR
jgi:hypothetical protein